MRLLDLAPPPPTGHFSASRERLDASVLELVRDVGAAVHDATGAFLARDAAAAAACVASAERIGVRGRRLDEECLKVLALYRPTGRDLRVLIAVQKLVHDLVRVGDLAGRIGAQGATPAAAEDDAPAAGLAQTSDLACGMLAGASDALLRRDAALAARVLDSRAAFEALRAVLLVAVESHISAHPAGVSSAVRTLTVLDALSRIAHRASRVAEDVVYLLEERILRRVC
jgi:phosphate transport system protein